MATKEKHTLRSMFVAGDWVRCKPGRHVGGNKSAMKVLDRSGDGLSTKIEEDGGGRTYFSDSLELAPPSVAARRGVISAGYGKTEPCECVDESGFDEALWCRCSPEYGRSSNGKLLPARCVHLDGCPYYGDGTHRYGSAEACMCGHNTFRCRPGKASFLTKIDRILDLLEGENREQETL